MDAQILAQLVRIKWLCAVLVFVIALRAVLGTWLEVRKSGGPNKLMRLGFEENARQLLESGRSEELLAISNSRCAEAPGDALAHWYYAMAAYRTGDISKAVKLMRNVGELQPDWRQSHVNPFLHAVAPSEPLAEPAAVPPSSLSAR